MQLQFSDFSYAQHLSWQFNFCTELYSWSSNVVPFYKAIVCGKSPEKQNFLGFLLLGLWHLLVVSAGHWMILEKLGKKLLPFISANTIRWTSWFIIVFLAGLNPPLLRALFSWRISKSSKNLGLNLKTSEIIFFSVLGCLPLCFFAESTLSFINSLIASWVLALALNLIQLDSYFHRTIIIQLLILPLTLYFNQDPALSLFGNVFIAPLIGEILFPMSLIAPLAPHWIDPLVEFSLDCLNSLAVHLQFFLPKNQLNFALSFQFLLCFVLNLQGLNWIFESQKMRKSSDA